MNSSGGCIYQAHSGNNTGGMQTGLLSPWLAIGHYSQASGSCGMCRIGYVAIRVFKQRRVSVLFWRGGLWPQARGALVPSTEKLWVGDLQTGILGCGQGQQTELGQCTAMGGASPPGAWSGPRCLLPAASEAGDQRWSRGRASFLLSSPVLMFAMGVWREENSGLGQVSKNQHAPSRRQGG